jgi:Tfp pilus assembly protein PilN
MKEYPVPHNVTLFLPLHEERNNPEAVSFTVTMLTIVSVCLLLLLTGLKMLASEIQACAQNAPFVTALRP